MIFVKYGNEERVEQILEGYIRFSPFFTYREYEENASFKVLNGISDLFDGMARMTLLPKMV